MKIYKGNKKFIVIHFIEMTDDYIEKIKTIVNGLIKRL